MKSLAVLSMLHEPADANSATRIFRGRSVLSWTLERVSRVTPGVEAAVLCWDDQLPTLQGVHGARSAGPRRALPAMDRVTVSRRWAEGWRGGPVPSACFDLGFHAASVAGAAGAHDAVLLIDPSASLVDPTLLSAMLAHAEANPDRLMVFMQTAPGLSGALLRRELLNELAASDSYPGKALTYHPDRCAHDPIATPACVPAPPRACRTLQRFTLDGPEQIERLSHATASLNGELISSTAEAIVGLVEAAGDLSSTPRDLRIDLTTIRATRAVFRPAAKPRPELPAREWARVIDQIAGTHTRLTLGGLGDPLLYAELPELLSACRGRGVPVCVETDLVGASDAAVAALAGVDVVVLTLPAASPATYTAVMGVPALDEVGAKLNMLLAARGGAGVVPAFVKLRDNLAEMEPWYDHYLRTLGAAVIDPPSNYAGRIADHAAADMSPPSRVPCRRLSSRMTLLSDGTPARCENDLDGVEGASVLATPLAELWRAGMEPLRAAHRAGGVALPQLCAGCSDWHRP